MSLIDRLKTLEATDSVNTCPMARVLSELDQETAVSLKRVLESGVPTMTIYRELHMEGIKIARDSIAHHRKGFCKCGGAQ